MELSTNVLYEIYIQRYCVTREPDNYFITNPKVYAVISNASQCRAITTVTLGLVHKDCELNYAANWILLSIFCRSKTRFLHALCFCTNPVIRSGFPATFQGGNMDKSVSEIGSFYKGKVIFVTGASGFMGKVLLEKLLYGCSDLDKIYILLRSKRNRSIETRLEDMFKLPVRQSHFWSFLPDRIKRITCDEKVIADSC